MRLVQVSLTNFRSYLNRTNITLSDTTAIVGKNEHGKSSILEALEIFFNNQTVKIDQDDPCVSGQNKIVEIVCAFDEMPDYVVLDDAAQTSLKEEYLLNPQGLLEIVKRYDCSKSKISPEIFIRANHPEDQGAKDLLLLKQADLRKRANDLNVDLTNVDQRSNVDLRRAIRNHLGNLTFVPTDIAVDKDNGKAIWEQMQKILPLYALFQSDRTSREDDSEIVDPMKLAVITALKEVEQQLEEIKASVKAKAMAVAQKTIDKLKEMDQRIANNLELDFKAEPKWDGFKLTLFDDRGVPINKRGSGTRRLILLNFFRAEVERLREDKKASDIIFAIEEPENSQHPDYQKMLIKALLSLGEQPHAQVILTTHVPGLAQSIPQEYIRFVEQNNTGHPVVSEADDQVLERVVKTLGVLPDSRVQVLVFVEGPHDVTFLENISEMLHLNDNNFLNLATDPRVVILPTGGGNLKHWISKKYLSGLGKKEVHLYDRDDPNNPPYAPAIAAVNARGDGSWGSLTAKRETENYIHPTAVQAIYSGITVTYGDMDDVPMIVAQAVHQQHPGANQWNTLSEEKKKRKASQVKTRLNAEATKKMTVQLLQAQDQTSEIAGWITRISQMLE